MSSTQSAGAGTRSSRLLDLLREYSRTPGGSRVGFLARPEARRRHLGVIAALQAIDARSIGSAIEAGADAVELPVTNLADARTLEGILGAATVPFGVTVPPTADAAVVEAAVKHGADWVHVTLGHSIAATLWERPARVLAVPAGLDVRVVPAINGLSIDALLIEGGLDSLPELTFAEALQLRAIRDLVQKPLLLHIGVGLGLPPALVAVCEQIGFDAIVLPVTAENVRETVGEYIAALQRAASDAS